MIRSVRFIVAVLAALPLCAPPVLAQLVNRPTQPLGPSAYMFAGTGLETGQSVSLWTPTSGNAFQASRQAIWTPDYPVWNCRLYYPNWMMRGSTSLSQELDGVQPITIERDTVQVGGGPAISVTFGGSLSTTIAAGGGIWSDPIPVTFAARTKLLNNVATAAQVATNSMFGMFQPNASLGEAFQTSSTSLASNVATGAVANTGSTSLFAYGAAAMACQGYDGRPVALVYGDSIATGTGEPATFADDRGNRGWLARGLDLSTNGATRFPFAKWAAPSAAARQVTVASDFTRRFQMIDALPNVPFTHILSQIGLNDATGSLSTWQTRITTALGLLRTKFPQARIIQFGFTPYTTADNSAGTTAAGQSFVTSHDWPSGFTQQVQNALAGLPSPVDQFVFIEDWFDNTSTRCGAGGGSAGKWRTDQTFSTTLAASTAANATTISLPLAPEIGAALAINAGNTGSAMVTVTNVSGGVGGNFTVTVFPAITSAQTSGATVREIAAQDLLHPSSAMARTAAACFSAIKSSVMR
ncbi:MAG: hypothetical protein K2X73_04560 [Sphingomonas sp.]|uniref:hypothetical protein n=1 Tax=Sphingomonas sp. TaxID=28214 RepID=UPI0025F00398|nr:hypothetical protein [Sphingomonas sp.]MBX9881226.1 hypothetical protein [Sphingomonas sp.]